jgi:hypothetical protein
MKRFTVSELGEHHLNFLEEVKRRHPKSQTVCGALLAEITSAESLKDRAHAADVFGLLKCRRGLRRLESLAEEIEPLVDFPTLGSPECRYFADLMLAIGRMDTASSHAALVRVLARAENPLVRALAIDGLAFEQEHFDLDLVLAFLRPDASREEICSSLYALEFWNYVVKCPKEARRRIRPYLKHEEPFVRMYAVEVLSFNEKNRDLILPLRADPSPHVTKDVERALRMWEADD